MESGRGRSDFFDFVFPRASGILSAMDAYANLPVPDEARPRLAELAALELSITREPGPRSA